MTFKESVSTCFRKFADFNGRARRSEFWWFYLFLQLVSMVIVGIPYVILIAALFGQAAESTSSNSTTFFTGGVVLALVLLGIGFLVSLALTLPSLAVSARRLHDTGQSGHWLWLNLLGLGLVPTIMCVMEGQPHDNQWGPDPKAAERAWQGPPPYAVPGYAAAGYAAASPAGYAPAAGDVPPTPPMPPVAPPAPPADPFAGPR